jgi:hypothetical protein
VTCHPFSTQAAYNRLSHVWGSHGGEIVCLDLLGCNAMWTCTYIPMFRRNIPPPFSGHMEAVLFSETFVSTSV